MCRVCVVLCTNSRMSHQYQLYCYFVLEQLRQFLADTRQPITWHVCTLYYVVTLSCNVKYSENSSVLIVKVHMTKENGTIYACMYVVTIHLNNLLNMLRNTRHPAQWPHVTKKKNLI